MKIENHFNCSLNLILYQNQTEIKNCLENRNLANIDTKDHSKFLKIDSEKIQKLKI